MIPKTVENIEYCQEEWLPIVLEQEEKLKVDSFTRQDAVELGMMIRKIAAEKYRQDIAVKIIMDGITVFSCFDGKTGLKNEWWMSCKYNTFLKTQCSSMLALLERAVGGKEFESWSEQRMSYFLCGGAFPIRTQENEILGCILVSALTHEDDHQLIIDALSEYLKISVPEVLLTE